MEKVVMIGNCQMTGIRRILEHTTFGSKYEVEQFANWQMIENKEAPPIQSLASADVVIYQPLSDVHGCYTTNPENPNNMLSVCKPGATLISMPRIHNNALWPVYAKRYARDEYYGGEYINANRTLSRNQILRLYDIGRLDFNFIDRYNRNMNMSAQREQTTDIKVANFVHANIRSRQVFLTHDHPTSCVFVHCVDQMLDRLRVSYKNSVDTLPDNLADLEESTYHLPTGRYPQSSYAMSAFNMTWSGNVDDAFYRQRLIDHLDYLKM